MTTVVIRENGFSCTGHAEYGPKGYDIVCAGISALVGAALQMIDWDTELKDGYVKAECNIASERRDTTILMLMYGLLDIQEQYPKNLKVEIII